MAQKEHVLIEEAREQVETAIMRITLFHFAFSKTLVEEFGAEKEKELITKNERSDFERAFGAEIC